jgi:hypothetical protein
MELLKLLPALAWVLWNVHGRGVLSAAQVHERSSRQDITSFGVGNFYGFCGHFRVQCSLETQRPLDPNTQVTSASHMKPTYKLNWLTSEKLSKWLFSQADSQSTLHQ